MPLISVECLEGRTVEQKRRLAKDITEAVVKHFNVAPDAVSIYITEHSKENVARAGKLFADS